MTKKTYYHLILDQSGSMQSCLNETISGFNEQVKVIRSLCEKFPNQEITIGLTRFNDRVMHTYSAVPPLKASTLDKWTYKPNGSTALLDAIGGTISKLKEELPTLHEENTNIVVVIITDGYENASRFYTHDQISSQIQALEETGKWTFSYIGAGLDAVETATKMNIKAFNSMSYNKLDVKDVFGKVSTQMNEYIKCKEQGHIKKNFLN